MFLKKDIKTWVEEIGRWSCVGVVFFFLKTGILPGLFLFLKDFVLDLEVTQTEKGRFISAELINNRQIIIPCVLQGAMLSKLFP